MDGYDTIKLLNDIDHILDDNHSDILKYQPYITCDKHREDCIHFKRATRNKNEYKSLKEKQDLFNCDNFKDFVYISYLDRIHSLILHSTDLRETKEDRHKIKKYSNFPVYSTGVYIQYDGMYLF